MTLPRELLAALGVSVVALLVDSAVLVSLTAGLSVPVLVAATAGFLAGSVVNWTLSVRYVFRHRRYASLAHELGLFLAIGVGVLALNDFVVVTVVDRLGLGVLAAKGIAACLTFGANFTLRRMILFTETKEFSWRVSE